MNAMRSQWIRAGLLGVMIVGGGALGAETPTKTAPALAAFETIRAVLQDAVPEFGSEAA